jgi:hypothetical protein
MNIRFGGYRTYVGRSMSLMYDIYDTEVIMLLLQVEGTLMLAELS